MLIEEHFPARFSVAVYLSCLSGLMVVSFLAFLLLWKTQPREKLPKEQEQEQVKGPLLLNEQREKKEEEEEKKFTGETWITLGVILWTSILLIGCIPSINSYSLNPYGASTFHYVIIACLSLSPLSLPPLLISVLLVV